jgi:hypothetical protein
MKHEVMSLTTDRVSTGTQQAASLHWRNVAEDKTRITEICVMSVAVERYVARSKTSIRSASAMNRCSTKKGIMITMVPIVTNLTDSILPKGRTVEESRAFPMT